MGPNSPFALLSPVLVSKIPFEKGFLENPFSPSINTTFCPVLGLLGPFGEPSMSFMHVFRKILVSNLIDNYYLVKFSVLCASLCVAESCCPILQTVSKHFLGVTWLEEPQVWHRPLLNLEMVLLPNHPSFLRTV